MSDDAPPILRPARDDDGEAIAGLIADCFAEYPGCIFDWREFPELRAPAFWAARGGTRLVVAEEADGRLVGVVAATPAAERNAVEWHKFYVAPAYRGRGLALRLAAEVMDEARERNADSIFLWTDTRFARAHRFYEKFGFRRLEGTRHLGDLSNSEEYHYVLPLAPDDLPLAASGR